MAPAAARFLVVAVFLLATTVSAQLISSVPVTPLLQLQAGRVIPDVLTKLSASPRNLTVTYPAETVSYGNELLVNQTQAAPTVNATTAGTGLYTLVLSDPDVPDPAVAGNSSGYLHWLVVDIPGDAATNITSAGVAVAPYQPPQPPIGLHRYVFQLYKQNLSMPLGNITFTRNGFLPKAFALQYSLDPVAACYFVAQPAGANNLTTNTTGLTSQVQALVRGRVIPQVVPLFTPLARLNVSYGNGSLSNGQILLPTEATSPPAVYVQGLAPGTIYNSTFPYFTLAIVDPDAPDPTTPTNSLILHYLKVNIPTNRPAGDIVNSTDGNVLQSYNGPNPPSGLHRYTFLLYGQGRLSINATGPATRSRFNLTSFALNNTLGSPLAGFYFSSIRPATTAGAPGPAPAPAPVMAAVANAPAPKPAK